MNSSSKVKHMRLVAVTVSLLLLESFALCLTPVRLLSRFNVTRPATLHVAPGTGGSSLSQDQLRMLRIRPDSDLRRFTDQQAGALSSLQQRNSLRAANLPVDLKGAFEWPEPKLPTTSVTLQRKPAPEMTLWFDKPVRPRSTVSELSAAIESKPKTALSDLHPDAGATLKRFQFDDAAVKRSIVALAQGLKAGASFDSPMTSKTFEQLQQQIRAADDSKELLAAVTEAEIGSLAHGADFILLRTSFGWDGRGRFKDDATVARDRAMFAANVERRLAEGLTRLRSGDQATLGDGVWGKYLRSTHGQVRIRSLKFTEDGRALIKLDTADFAEVTGEIPYRAVAQKISDVGSYTPEVEALLPRD